MMGRVTVQSERGVSTIILDRPDHKNALTNEMIGQLTAGLDQASRDAEARVVVLRGAGKDFCTGLDLDEFYRSAEATEAEHRREADQIAGVLLRLMQLRRPTVALVQGRALGIGATLAAACDLVVASDGATFAFPEVTYGFVPAFAAAILPRLIGERAAFELLLTGRTLRATEARALGLVSRLVADEGFDAVTASVIRHLGAGTVETFETMKHTFRELEGKSLEEALAIGAEWNARARASEAFRDAARQFFSMA
jgi:methylglutaconyl-CoA hydratase